MNSLTALTALSPLDGRYAKQTAELQDCFSEYALIKHRVKVEIKWLICLASMRELAEVPKLNKQQISQLDKIWQNFSIADAKQIKNIEAKILHDIKALEMWLGKKLSSLGLDKHISFIHFGCTSEDINNLAYAMMIERGRRILLREANAVCQQLAMMAKNYSDLAMPGRTHGQEATPTTLGKEMAVFAYRLSQQLRTLEALPLNGKFSGATGNYNTWVGAYPKMDWQKVSKSFVESFGFRWMPYSTQIESHDGVSEMLSCIARMNAVLVGLCRDIWGYCAIGYFILKKNAGEVGSSTMPHKINPEKFENAEGNLELASSLCYFLAGRLMLSRWQRDLTDSSLQRNLGTAFGHSLLGYKSCLAGLDRLSPNEQVIKADIENRWALLSELLQTLMRKEGAKDAYDFTKKMVRGKALDYEGYQRLVKSSGLDEATQQTLLKMTPADYTGLAPKLARKLKNPHKT